MLELGQLIAAPYCAMLLGDMGAEVIKIERLGTGESARTLGSIFVQGESSSFPSLNRNKGSMTMDPTRP